jgi:hypothetical protein
MEGLNIIILREPNNNRHKKKRKRKKSKQCKKLTSRSAGPERTARERGAGTFILAGMASAARGPTVGICILRAT